MKNQLKALLLSSALTFNAMASDNNTRTFQTDAGNTTVSIEYIDGHTIMKIVDGKLKGRVTIAYGDCIKLWYHAKGETLLCETNFHQYDLKLY